MKNNGNVISVENYIDYWNFISEILLDIGLTYNELLELISNLEITDEVLIVSDFDDTLLSREEQLKNPLLRDNRGDEGNKIIREVLGGFKIFVENYIHIDGLTTELVEKIRENISLILSAGINEFQTLKIKKVELDDIPRVIVLKNSKKPLALLKYILFELKKIPALIEIYDDRVEHLCEKSGFIADLLNTKIIVKEVKLSGTRPEGINLNIINEYCFE